MQIYEEAWQLWVVTLGVAIPLVSVLLACACCRKTVPKTSASANRSLPDIPVDSQRIQVESGDTLWENSEHNGDTSSELYATVGENKQVSLVVTRTTSGTNRNRSLQDGPTDESRSSDHSSLSQTDDNHSPYARLKAEHQYDKLRSEHPYAQVGPNSVLDAVAYEFNNGYGNHRTSVQHENSHSLRPSTSSESGTRPLSSQAGMSTNPVPPPRTRKSSSHNSLLLAPATTLLPGSVPDIQAATAIAGHISANQELPYMTPPLPSQETNPPQQQQQQQSNFSGDSQDSKGYTSISVREPLANIKAQTTVTNQRSRTQELVDSHYATVSDDSDEMYAAIEEMGGSETYAQIQPLAVLDITSEANSDGSHYPPQPPSVDSLKHVAQVHSRQASSSSAASSVANLGSPKPEKRQANSPLPPPPAGSPDLYATVDKRSTVLSVSRNPDEMYAKVIKKKKKLHGAGSDVDQGQQQGAGRLEHTDNLSHASINTASSQGSPELRTQQELDRNSACSLEHDSVIGLDDEVLHPGYKVLHSSSSEQCLMPANGMESSYEGFGEASSSYHDPGYEVVKRNLSDCDPNYEELHPQSADSSHANSHVNFVCTEQCRSESDAHRGRSAMLDGLNIDPGYEQVRRATQGESSLSVNKHYDSLCEQVSTGYASEVGDKSVPQPDPGYEQVRRGSTSDMGNHAIDTHNVSSDEHDPGYEQVRCSGAYSSVMRNFDNKLTDAPSGYERLQSKGSSDADTCSGPDPDYASVERNRDASDDTGDPNYESMSSEGQDMVSGMTDDPNYETVRYFHLPCDPPYERLHNETRDSDGASSGYERVKDCSDLSVPDADEKHLTEQSIEPGYEEVGMRWDIVNGDDTHHIESSTQESSCHPNEGNDNVCQPQSQTSATRM